MSESDMMVQNPAESSTEIEPKALHLPLIPQPAPGAPTSKVVTEKSFPKPGSSVSVKQFIKLVVGTFICTTFGLLGIVTLLQHGGDT